MRPRPIEISEDTPRFSTLQAFTNADPQTLPSGVYEIQHGLPIHVWWRNAGADVTLVIFSAAVGRSVKTLPVFNGVKVTNGLDANVVLISDPTLALDEKLKVGWYVGNQKQPYLQRVLTTIIKGFQGDGRVVLFGASGGGFPALHQNMRLRNATTFLVNPSVDLTVRPTYPTYLELAWGLGPGDQLPEHVVTDLKPAYSRWVGNQVFYLQNSFDELFCTTQFWPFLHESSKVSKIHYLTPYMGAGHVPLSWSSTREVLKLLVSTGDWDELKQGFAQLPLTSVRHPENQLVSSPVASSR